VLVWRCAIADEAPGDGINRAWGFGSMMEVQCLRAIQGFRQAGGCDLTAEWVETEQINLILCDFIKLNICAQQLNYELNICKCLYCVMCQVLKCWAMTSTGVRDFGSMMEVLHAGAIRGFEQIVGCNCTAEGLGMAP
jgi:hypothetical protein